MTRKPARKPLSVEGEAPRLDPGNGFTCHDCPAPISCHWAEKCLLKAERSR